MTRYYAAYCMLLLALLAYADAQGYSFTQLFEGQAHASHSANHYHK